MDKIKTLQPYKLLKVLFRDKSTAKSKAIKVGLIALGSCLIMSVFDPEILIGVPLILLLMALMSSPFMIYNPKIGENYVPKESFRFFRKIAKGELPAVFGNMYKSEDKELRKFHSNVDHNTNLDLYDLYGVNDKLIISYQNFDFKKQKLEDGDYLLGVSAQGIYCVCKNGTVTKTKINFDEIDSVGLLYSIFRPQSFVLQLRSKKNEEINAILYLSTSLVVHPFIFINSLLEALDDFIENGGGVSNNTSRRRRVVVNSGTTSSTSNDMGQNDSGRSLDLGETNTSTNEEQETSSSNRVVDITFSQSILEEMAGADYVESNRKIDL